MTSVTSPSNSKPEAQIDLAPRLTKGPTSAPEQNANPSRQSTARTGDVTGLTSGNADFDAILDRLHVAFGELARTDDDLNDAADAADDLSSRYTSITGRNLPRADDGANLLAADLRQGLTAIPHSLTDRLGQTMLRSI